jgi:phage-related protein
MATFPNIESSYGFSKSGSPEVNISQFGSGYSQRTTFGINQNLKTWDLRWENLGTNDGNLIEDFLDARAGKENFDFTPPGESESSKFICRQWTRTVPFPNLVNIQAKFEQVAEA